MAFKLFVANQHHVDLKFNKVEKLIKKVQQERKEETAGNTKEKERYSIFKKNKPLYSIRDLQEAIIKDCKKSGAKLLVEEVLFIASVSSKK